MSDVDLGAPARHSSRAAGSRASFGTWSETRGLQFDGYLDFWRWSVADLNAFWGAVFAFEDVLHDGDPSTVLADASMPGARWFPDVQLNYAEHLLRRSQGDETALVFEAEDGSVEETSWAELERQAGALAATLRRLGIGRGDRVVALMPELPRGDDRLDRVREHRRRLVGLLAGVRPDAGSCRASSSSSQSC